MPGIALGTWNIAMNKRETSNPPPPKKMEKKKEKEMKDTNSCTTCILMEGDNEI